MSDQEDNTASGGNVAQPPPPPTSTIINYAGSSNRPTVTITSHEDQVTNPSLANEGDDNGTEARKTVDEASAVTSMAATRNESVIRSPPKAISTPVIKVLDHSTNTLVEPTSTSQQLYKDSEVKRSLGTNVITSATSSAPPTSFLHSSCSKVPTNPFLRTSLFSSPAFGQEEPSSNSDTGSDTSSSVIFAAPKLMPSLSHSTFDSSFFRPSVLRVGESLSSIDDSNKPKESVSAIPTFISLNKDDIGKIKTPSFIKSSMEASTSSTINGFSSLFSTDKPDTNGGSGSSATAAAAAAGGEESTTVTSTDSKPSFLFGEKLSERVVMSVESSPMKKELRNEPSAARNELLLSFSDVTSTNQEVGGEGGAAPTISTASSSNEDNEASIDKDADDAVAEQNKQQRKDVNSKFKRKYEVITGEEDEHNVLSIYGKLYAWDNEKVTWVEKGRGQLRLNDVIKNDKLCSRLVMRTTGALRVILNAHILAGMKFELSNDNCLRFTYVDGIYLIKANGKDIEQLNSAIEYRLREITKRAKTDDKPLQDDGSDEESNGDDDDNDDDDEDRLDAHN